MCVPLQSTLFLFNVVIVRQGVVGHAVITPWPTSHARTSRDAADRCRIKMTMMHVIVNVQNKKHARFVRCGLKKNRFLHLA